MYVRLTQWLSFFMRSPAIAVLTIAVLLLLGWGGWRGLNQFQFRRHLAAAEQALAEYDFAESRGRIGSCLALRPNDPQVLLLAARTCRRDGQLEEAAGYLDRHRAATGSSTPESQLESVLIQVQLGHVKQYVDRLIENLEIRHPASEQILESLALGCVHVYRLDEATFWTNLLRDRFPQNALGRLLDAQTQDTLHHREKAQPTAEQLVADFPKYDKARLYLAGLLFDTNQYEQAVPHYQLLHRRRPDDLEPLLHLASALVNLERIEEARPLFLELQAKHTDSSQALLEIGRFAIQEDRPEDAEPLLRRAAELTPYDHEIHLDLATALERLGRSEESRTHLERFEQIEADMKLLDAAFQAMVKAPSDPEPRLQAGRICLRNGQVTEGLRWLSGVLDLVPDHQATHEALADYYESQGEKALAKQHRVQIRPSSRTNRQEQ